MPGNCASARGAVNNHTSPLIAAFLIMMGSPRRLILGTPPAWGLGHLFEGYQHLCKRMRRKAVADPVALKLDFFARDADPFLGLGICRHHGMPLISLTVAVPVNSPLCKITSEDRAFVSCRLTTLTTSVLAESFNTAVTSR